MLFVLLDYFTIFSLSVVCFWLWLGIFRVISVQKKSLTHEPSRLLCYIFLKWTGSWQTIIIIFIITCVCLFLLSSFLLTFISFSSQEIFSFFFQKKKNSEMQVFLNECIHRHFVLNAKKCFICKWMLFFLFTLVIIVIM